MKNYEKVNKRKRTDWVSVLRKVGTDEMFVYFAKLQCKYQRRKRSNNLSANRCAYNTLKHYYSTTTIKQLFGKVGSL